MLGRPALSEFRNSCIGAALRVLVAGVGVAMAAGGATAQATSMDDYLDRVRVEYGLPALAAAVFKDGVVVAAAATGTRVYGQVLPVTMNDRFHIGSNTKSMTATLAVILVEDGKLAWDSRVGNVLGEDVPEISQSLANATLEQLLSHSSGIPSDTEEMLDLYFSDAVFDDNLVQQRIKAIEDGRLKVCIVRVYNRLRSVPEAQENLESGSIPGKHVILFD